MLLHSSDVNKQREIAGLETVNSLWFWGSGKPVSPKVDFDRIISRQETTSLLQGQYFAKAANCMCIPLPEDSLQPFDLIDNNFTNQVLILDQLYKPALENNFDNFKRELLRIDSQFLRPLFEVWKKNKLDIVIDCCEGTILKPQRTPSWKFWSKPKKLRELVNEINS